MSLLDHLTPHLPWRPARGLTPVEVALGVDHPLCRSERELTSAVSQVTGTGIFVASVAAFARFQGVGVVLFVGVAMLAATSIRLTAAVIRRQLRTMDAIAAGLEDVPSSHVRRARARLLGRREREHIARSLATYLTRVNAARLAYRPSTYAPPPMAADGAQEELQAVIALLRGDAPCDARGVALCHKLLWDYPSPLHGDDPVVLRAQLGRIRFLLSR